MLTPLAKVLKLLNSEQSPSQLAAALSIAMIMGLTPLVTLHNLLLLAVALLFRVNLSLLILSYPFFALIGLMLNTPFALIGEWLLQIDSLQGFYNAFYNTLLGRWSLFYYSAVTGSLVCSVILAMLGYPLFKLMIVKYRAHWMEQLKKFKLVQMFKASKFWSSYEKLSQN